MPHNYRTSLFIIIVAALYLGGISGVSPGYAQNSVQFSEVEVENHFPDELIFRAWVSSAAGEIVSAKFVYTYEKYYSSSSYTKDTVEIEPGTKVFLEYVLDTRDFTTPPLMPIAYHWDVMDVDGNHYTSEPEIFHYADIRFDWQVMENSNIGVWWHDRPESFGETIFEIAIAAVEHQRDLFQADLDYKMKIIIYNNSAEFAAWHNLAHDWVGGETYSNYGITVQIVKDSGYLSGWLNNVIPHEISHLYFDQVTYNSTVSIPVWLNEGVAQYNEFVSQDWALEEVNAAAKDGGLIPLSSLANGFGAFDEERVYLAYHEALSAVTYLVDSYGNEGLGTLLAAYKDGITTEEAFQLALGISARQFELDWAASVGATNYAIPTARVLPTFFPSPTAPSITNQSTPVPRTEPAKKVPALPCMSVLLLLGFVVGIVWPNRGKKR